jgi:hypothetical protein
MRVNWVLSIEKVEELEKVEEIVDSRLWNSGMAGQQEL